MTQISPGSIGAPQTIPGFPEKTKRKGPPKPLLLLPIVVVAGSIGYAIWQSLPRTVNRLTFSGRVEVYETDIGVKRAGRVESVLVREGAMVKRGTPLVTLDNSNDQVLQDQVRGAEARILTAQQEVEQARSEIASAKSDIAQVESQILEASLNVQQSQGDSQGRIGQARSQVAAAKAQLLQAEAQATQSAAEQKLAAANRDRYAALITQGAINQQEYDQTETTLLTAAANYQARLAAVNAAREQYSAAAGGYIQTQSTKLNPNIRSAQLAALNERRKQNQAKLKVAVAKLRAAEANVKDAKASQQQLKTQLQDSQRDSNVVSPIHGIVTARSVEPGKVVDSQSTLLTLIDPKTVYFRGFLPQGDIGHVRLGQLVKIRLDSAIDKPLQGKVIAIDPQASFTPENIYFQADRVKQVVGVRVSVENPDGCNNPNNPYAANGKPCAKQGMPGDAEILLTEDAHS
jgi:HlyD family secretion protein